MDSWRVPGYVELAALGEGASGRVVAAVEESTGERVAIKYLAPSLAADQFFRVTFRAEAVILAGLQNPHVARLRWYVEDRGGAAIIMDLVDGVALRRILTACGPAAPLAALTVLKGSLLGLAGAHAAGIVHRDYKPENVMVDRAGSSILVDFGIALRSGTPTAPLGTPGYMGPEQWQGAPASPASDIYAAAVTFTECVTGVAPPRGPAPPSAAAQPALPGDRFAALIAWATAPDPAQRPADAATFLAELQQAADQAYGPGWEGSGKAVLARGAAFVLAAGAGAAAGWRASQRRQQRQLRSAMPTPCCAAGARLAASIRPSG
jgi:serine/threonine protein kinase